MNQREWRDMMVDLLHGTRLCLPDDAPSSSFVSLDELEAELSRPIASQALFENRVEAVFAGDSDLLLASERYTRDQAGAALSAAAHLIAKADAILKKHRK